jgi:hypothetical protein
MMSMTRRGFVLAAGLGSLARAVASAVRPLKAAAAAAAPGLRPDPRGSSAHVCARCGAPDHDALDLRCPEGSDAAIARQAAARRMAGEAWSRRS